MSCGGQNTWRLLILHLFALLEFKMPRPPKLVPAKPQPRVLQVELRALPIPAFARAHGIHVTTVWRALRAGRIKAVMVGKRRLVLLDSVREASTEPAPLKTAI